jgi:DNA-binding NtrC family response regulator
VPSEEKTASGTFDGSLGEVRVRVLVVREELTSVTWLKPDADVVIGRSEECDVVIDHASVSRKHLRLRCGSVVTIEDLGSSHGTIVAGERLAKGAPRPIAADEPIELGRALVFVRPPRARASGRADWRATLERVARSKLAVLLLGETGVGKTVAARAVHDASPRAKGPFVHLSCAAVPETMLEAELFGFEAGAFTGAVKAKPGLVESAHGGTLFLDEIGDMPLATQAKLLTALESGTVARLGSVAPRPIDLRIVSATNVSLDDAKESGRFRRDLFYRLAGITVALPPLRERRTEIPELARRFFVEACAENARPELVLSSGALAKLASWSWPGNVRELKNVVARAVAMADGPEVLAVDVSLPDEPEPAPVSLDEELRRLERQRIVEALERAGGNQSRAAELLGMPRRTLITRLETYGLKAPPRKS